jgi:hypothetical protein
MIYVLYECLDRIRKIFNQSKEAELQLLTQKKTIVDTHNEVKPFLSRQDLAEQTQQAQKQINNLEALIRKEQKTQQQCVAVIENINEVLNKLATVECKHTNISVLESSTYSIFAGVWSRKKHNFKVESAVILVVSDSGCEKYSLNDLHFLTETLLTCGNNLNDIFDICESLLSIVPANAEVFCIRSEGVELQVLIPIHELITVPTGCSVSYTQGRIDITPS